MALRRTPEKENGDPAPLPASSIEFLMRLEDAGLTEELVQIVVEEKDNTSAKRVITLLEELTRLKRMERTLIKSDVLLPHKEIVQRILLLSQSGHLAWYRDGFDYFNTSYKTEFNKVKISISKSYDDSPIYFKIGDISWNTHRGGWLRLHEEFKLAQETWNICKRQVERRKNEKAHSLLKNLGG